MTIKVLHIFSPSLKTRFGGPSIRWKYNFENWHDPGVVHYVLDCDERKVDDARVAFNFNLPENQSSPNRWQRLTWTFKLINQLSKYAQDFDVIHFHVLWWGSLFAARWCKRRKIPCIYESVLLDADNPGSIEMEKFGKIKVHLLKDFRGILAISDYLAEDYRRHEFNDNQVFTLMNSVDSTLFRPCETLVEKQELREKYALPLGKTILLFVGSVIERKGVDLLVKAFINASLPNPDLYLLIIGPYNMKENPSLDETFINSLKDQLNKRDLFGSVNFYGLVNDRNMLADLFRASDIFVFPSRREGLGNVVLEAMASGLPVIISDLPVLARVIKVRENGLVVPIDDDMQLAEAITCLNKDELLSKELGKAAQEYTVENHRFLSWQKSLVEIYQKLNEKQSR